MTVQSTPVSSINRQWGIRHVASSLLVSATPDASVGAVREAMRLHRHLADMGGTAD